WVRSAGRSAGLQPGSWVRLKPHGTKRGPRSALCIGGERFRSACSQDRLMRIAVVGSGGVGGYFGGRLAASGSDVAFIARGAHLAALRPRGLRIVSPLGDVELPRVVATDDPSSIGPVDVVFLTVKLYDTDPALALLTPLIGDDTVVLPFQNGVESV